MAKVFKSKNSFFKLNKSFSLDWILVFIVSCLCIFGLAVLASSLSVKTVSEYQDAFFKQLFLGIGLGTIGAIILSQVDYHILLQRSKWLLWLNYLLLGFLALFASFLFFRTLGVGVLEANNIKANFIASLRFLPIKPHIANGAIRWIDFVFLPNFQPSEFTKIALLIYFSFVLWKNENQKITWMTLKKPLYALILSSVLILTQPDLGTVLLIFAIILSSLWVCKVPLKIIVYIALVVGVVGASLAFFVSYRADRITAFVDSSTDQAAQIRGVQQAITNGGFWGKGYGNSEFKQQPGRLFEQSTDAIISIIGEEFGYFGTIIFLFFYVWLLYRGLQIAKDSPDNGGRALATGIVIWITAQAFINIFGMLGLIPLKGIPLPFVSQGGSSIVINLLAVGILLNVSKQRIKDS